jgi:hypothetical protein
MFHNTHATVGQSQGRVVLSARKEGNCKTQIAKRKLQNGNSSTLSAVPRSLSPRFGLSLTEVLISMGILTMGLLGVASIFPVASFYMQKGDVSDRGSAIAQAAFNEAITDGTVNPENWLVWADGLGASPFTAPNSLGTQYTFERPFAEMLRRSKAQLAVTTTLNEADKQARIAREYGSFFVIDPRGIASIAQYNPGTQLHTGLGSAGQPYANFPTSSPALPTTAYGTWWPWIDSTLVGTQWPVRRVTLRGIPQGSAESVVAGKKFSTADDLSINLAAGPDKPAVQPWDVAAGDLNSDGNLRNDVLTRQSRGDYSWIVTVGPTSAAGRDALATDPSSHSYEVSVVVFHKRPLGIVSPSSGTETNANKDFLDRNERIAQAKIVSTGLSGGEILLERHPNDPRSGRTAEDPYANLKTGNWILLCGPHPNSTRERPLVTARWYQVLAIEGKSERLNSRGDVTPAASATDPERRLVSLRGPEWPWQPATNGTGNPDLTASHLSNSLYVCIPSGAVAVHAKTIRLGGNTTWSGGASGIGIATPFGAPAPRGNARN